MATVDYFLRIAGIEGASADAKHKGWIDVDAWSWGEANTAGPSGGGGGAGAGKVVMQDVQVTTRVSKASPPLLAACASGKHFADAQLVARRAAGRTEAAEFLSYTFKDVQVTAYAVGSAEAGGVPVDQLSFRFAQILVEYRAQKADGSLDAPVKAGWDVKANRQL